jgi:hypothetical protein
MKKNIISWYDFKENSKILYYGEENSDAYKYLKEKKCVVEKVKEENIYKNLYDYLVVLSDDIKVEKILESCNYLNEDAIILFAFDNEYGISKFVTYEYTERISPLEKANENIISKEKIKKIFEDKGYKYIKTYMPFPNWKYTDVIVTEKVDDLSEKIDKYFPVYEDDSIVLANEINLLKKIAKYDQELFTKLSNSYLLEISKKSINTSAKYISFNNYRKKEYQLITIIKDSVVQKKAATKESEKHINNIAKNLNLLDNYNICVLDKFENNVLFSEYIKNKNTLDIELALHYKDEQFLIEILENLKKILLEKSIKYNKKDKREYIDTLKTQKDETLEKFNYLEFAFYDMVPKNCFYIDNKYYFFDQEWMEKYLPVEFIIYRSIINSYDLVKKIDVSILFEKLGIKEYINLFEQIDTELRKKILDKEVFNIINKNYKKMYEIVYENEVLKKANEDYKNNDKKQNEYIKYLEKQLKEGNK